MKIKTMRLLPILLASAISAVSCTGVQDVANVNPTNTSLTVKGNYTYSEVIDSIQTQLQTENTPPQYMYLERQYSLLLEPSSGEATNTARLFITEWASADRVIIMQYVGNYTVSNNTIQVKLQNKTICDGLEINVSGQVQNNNVNQLKLALQNCPPAAKYVVLTAESDLSNNIINSTAHN